MNAYISNGMPNVRVMANSPTNAFMEKATRTRFQSDYAVPNAYMSMRGKDADWRYATPEDCVAKFIHAVEQKKQFGENVKSYAEIAYAYNPIFDRIITSHCMNMLDDQSSIQRAFDAMERAEEAISGGSIHLGKTLASQAQSMFSNVISRRRKAHGLFLEMRKFRDNYQKNVATHNQRVQGILKQNEMIRNAQKEMKEKWEREERARRQEKNEEERQFLSRVGDTAAIRTRNYERRITRDTDPVIHDATVIAANAVKRFYQVINQRGMDPHQAISHERNVFCMAFENHIHEVGAEKTDRWRSHLADIVMERYEDVELEKDREFLNEGVFDDPSSRINPKKGGMSMSL